MTAARKRAERQGRGAELLAAVFLMAKGYRIWGRRVTTRAGEIDLIARRGEYIAFIEVKMRTSGDLEELVSARQRDRIMRAASLWRARFSGLSALHTRYDIIVMTPWRWPKHHRAAWIPEGQYFEQLL